LSEPRTANIKHYLPYVALLLVVGLGLWFILSTGSRIFSERPVSDPTSTASSSSAARQRSNQTDSVLIEVAETFRDNLRNPLSTLLLQLVVIIATTRLTGKLFQRMGQPPVLGEIVAGIVLGPSLLGWISPAVMNFLFPVASMGTLKLLSQLGVVLFMFVVGMDLDIEHLRQRAHTAIMVSHASIVVPFFLGAALSLLVYQSLATPETSFTAFALFLGIAMSITAFPVLARILEDRRMSQSQLGTMALTCAAVDDVTAWCLLALVIAVAQSVSLTASFLTILLTLVFILAMLLIVKPQVARLLEEKSIEAGHSRRLVAAILVFVFGCALLTETIGIHALFGAFIAGIVMPYAAGIRTMLKEKLETFSAVALLPLFFAFTGLRMQLTLLNDWQGWAICGVIVAVAIVGKLGASMLMAKWTGMTWRDSFSLGALMNTRGLVELVVLNIGYDLGIVSARAFAMLVLMALITTFMTGPLLSLVETGQSPSMK
jgi:Kef-type K+ transport system membrane component KefB